MAEIADFYLEDLHHDGDFGAAPNGDLAIIKGKLNLRQQLLHRLITVPGTIVHRPTYGVGVQQWKGDIGSIGRQQALALRIKEQFEQDFRVVKVKGIRIIPSEGGLFSVEYSIEAAGLGAVVDVINPFGELSF